jgi:hypothetical protein
LGHAAKLGVVDPGRAVGRGYELCKALHVGLGVVLVWRLVASSVGRHKPRLQTCQCPKLQCVLLIGVGANLANMAAACRKG